MLVCDLMTPDPLTLNVNEDVNVAGMFMHFAHIRHLPVVDCGRVVGLVTGRDLLKASVERSEGRQVADIMRTDVIVIQAAEEAINAIDLMMNHKYGCLPVVDDTQIVGILTEADFMKFAKREIIQKTR